MNKHYELVIIGAGAAGLSAAITASKHGLKIALLDEQNTVGGQIYRGVETVSEVRAVQLGEDYRYGKTLAEAFHLSGVDYFPNTQVWSLNKQREIGLIKANETQTLTADHVIIATGAMERPVPFLGWHLTGVMNAGAGQVLFKSAGVVPETPVVLAGSGPLLILLAAQYIRAGVTVKALLDMSTTENHISALSKLPRALLKAHYLIKGMHLQQELKQANVPILERVSELKAFGSDDKLATVEFMHKGMLKTLDTQLLLTHFGVIPHVWLTQAVGCEHLWNDSQQCWRPTHDQWGQTSLEGFLIAGDGGGINGAKAAEYAGEMTALQVVCLLGGIDQQQRNQFAKQAKKAKKSERHIRPFLERWFAVSEVLLSRVEDETLICRCEEVSAGEIREAIHQGHDDSNQVKFITRCGMGACQGRQCANAVAHIVASETGKSVKESGLYRGRPPVTPITIGQLAALAVEGAK
ncbi:MAG: FAD-dependent oxidoreductase [Methylococcales bacterium]|nr:FAD-dependent oxidoreductase [Methylococcales bacterium]